MKLESHEVKALQELLKLTKRWHSVASESAKQSHSVATPSHIVLTDLVEMEQMSRAYETLNFRFELQQILERNEIVFSNEPLPKELEDDFRRVFGINVPPMNGIEVATLAQRVVWVKRAICDKIQYNKNLSYCVCGCGYVVGCDSP